MLGLNTDKRTQSVKPTSSEKIPEDSFSVSDVADLLLTSTTRSSGATEGATPRITSKHYARSTTESDTGYGGIESIDYVISLSKNEQKKWVLLRLAAFQEAMVLYATVAQQAKERGKSVSEAEWEAILATDGLTRAVPQEQHVYQYILLGKGF